MAECTPNLAKPQTNVRIVTGWTIFFMVLLRVVIGWHFAYEGVWKLVQEDWRATSFLVQSSGPFREVFRWMVKDVDGLERLTAESIKDRIDKRFDLFVDFYDLKPASDEAIAAMTDPQAKAKAQKKADLYNDFVAWKERKKVGDPNDPNDKNYVDAIFADPDFQQALADYKELLTEVGQEEARLGEMDYNKERLMYDYGKKAQALAALLARVEAPLRQSGPMAWDSVEGYILVNLNQEQLANGPVPGDKSQTALIDLANMWALTLIGICLMLGLFTRFAAIGGAGLLCMYYFAMPPWPGLPESPMAGGHYLIVNRNMVEAVALLMIATSRIGRWGGLDAYVSRFCSRSEASSGCGTCG